MAFTYTSSSIHICFDVYNTRLLTLHASYVRMRRKFLPKIAFVTRIYA